MNQSNGGTNPAFSRIVLLLIAVLLTTFLAIRFTDLPGSSPSDDTPELLAQTGCFDMDLNPADHEPPVSRSEAEADVRSQLHEVESMTGVGPDQGNEDEVGDLLWADYGELAPGTGGRVASGLAWVLVFEFEQDVSWWERLTMQDEEHRFSVIYRPDTGRVSSACGAPAS